MCFPKPKQIIQQAPAPTTPAYVPPPVSAQAAGVQLAPGVSVKGYDGNGSTNISSSNSGDSDDMAIRRRRRSAATGLGL